MLHGGGNTSVKLREKNLFGEEEDVLYVKGSGWDLETIARFGERDVERRVHQHLLAGGEIGRHGMKRNRELAQRAHVAGMASDPAQELLEVLGPERRARQYDAVP